MLYPGLIFVLISQLLCCVLDVVCIVVGFSIVLDSITALHCVIQSCCDSLSLQRGQVVSSLYFSVTFAALACFPYATIYPESVVHLCVCSDDLCTLQTCIANAGVVLVNLEDLAIPYPFLACRYVASLQLPKRCCSPARMGIANPFALNARRLVQAR